MWYLCVCSHTVAVIVCEHAVTCFIARCPITAVVLSGKEASGKTSALNTVVAVLNSQQSCPRITRVQKLFPAAHSTVEDLFGQSCEAGGWSDGIFISLLKKAAKVCPFPCN